MSVETTMRVILHADMDAFYASVEQRDNPHLRGRPVAVGGAPPRGVVSAASYEARPYGVRSAMPMATALKRCPRLVVLQPRMSQYAGISQHVFGILRSYSPLVEPLSLDEAFVDLSGTEKLHGPARTVAETIKRRVRDELELVVSVGLAPNKFLAKIASDIGKPDGLVVVGSDQVEDFLHPLPVSRLWGVGKVAARRMHQLGIDTVGDLAAYPRAILTHRLGHSGDHLWQLAHGIDERPVVADHHPKSIGHEETFQQDVTDSAKLHEYLQQQADRVASRLRRHGYVAHTVVLRIKTTDFKLHTKRRSLARGTCDGPEIGHIACNLLEPLLPGLGPVRLTGVSAAGLALRDEPRQLSFGEAQTSQKDRLGTTLDEIAAKFGTGVLRRGSTPKEH